MVLEAYILWREASSRSNSNGLGIKERGTKYYKVSWLEKHPNKNMAVGSAINVP